MFLFVFFLYLCFPTIRMHSHFAIRIGISLLLLISQLPFEARGMKDSAYRANRPYPKNFIAVGFSDRLMRVSKEPYRISYFNQGKTVNDTFDYFDPIKSNGHLVNFVLTGGVSNRYVGAKLDLGFVPFANRNSHQSLSAFALIPIGKNILMGNDVPEFLGKVNENENRSKIFVSAESREEADKIFNGLSAGGTVEAPIGDSPWGSYFGMFRDKFGIEWMVDFDPKYN